MASAKSETRELHLRDLPAFHASLVAALAEAGMSGARLHEVFEGHVRGECMQCGSPASGAELAHATAVGTATADLNPRVARLAQGYCGRKDCPSYFYRLSFAPAEGVAWEGLLERADALGAVRARVEKLEQDAQGTARTAPGRQRMLLAAGVLAALLGLWVVKRLISGQPLPGFEAKPKYQVDPASLPPPPGSRP
ncbi:MAG: hypothetical protein ACKVYV_11965 [Limisphaerales bacterium]